MHMPTQESAPFSPSSPPFHSLFSRALNANELSGSIPASVGNLEYLDTLELADNSLTGSIPESIGSLVQLTLLNLTANQLTGPIPTTICNLSQLVIL
ncbi:unnamed protein product [Closterium sp. NIES-54]